MLFKIVKNGIQQTEEEYFTVPVKATSQMEADFWEIPMEFSPSDTRDSVIGRAVTKAISIAKQRTKDGGLRLLAPHDRKKVVADTLIAMGHNSELWVVSKKSASSRVAAQFLGELTSSHKSNKTAVGSMTYGWLLSEAQNTFYREIANSLQALWRVDVQVLGQANRPFLRFEGSIKGKGIFVKGVFQVILKGENKAEAVVLGSGAKNGDIHFSTEVNTSLFSVKDAVRIISSQMI